MAHQKAYPPAHDAQADADLPRQRYSDRELSWLAFNRRVLDLAADAMVNAGFGSTGERCMAISVAVPVGEATADRLRALLEERIATLTLGPSLEPSGEKIVDPVGPKPVEGSKAKDEVWSLLDDGSPDVRHVSVVAPRHRVVSDRHERRPGD